MTEPVPEVPPTQEEWVRDAFKLCVSIVPLLTKRQRRLVAEALDAADKKEDEDEKSPVEVVTVGPSEEDVRDERRRRRP